jgi:hypothetical protein
MALDDSGTLATARIKLVADARGMPDQVKNQTEKQLGDAGDKAGSTFGKRMTTAIAATVAVGAAIVGKKLVTGLKESITAASDLNEITNKASVVFGKGAKDIEAFAATASTSLGQTKAQALDAASTFAVFGKGANLGGKELVKFSSGLVTTATDMASFSNTTPTEAIDSIGAALRGEFDPIEKYGVLLNQTNVQAEALSLGLLKGSVDVSKVKEAQLRAIVAQKRYNEALKDHGKSSKEAASAHAALISAENRLKTVTSGSTQQLTSQQRVLAVQSLIMKQTSDAQGDFARTSNGLANQQRILTAQFGDLKASIGQALLPIVLKLTTVLTSRVMPTLQELWSKNGPAVIKFLDNAATKFGAFVGSIDATKIREWANDLKQAFQNLRTEAGPALAQLRENIGPAGDTIRTKLVPAFKQLRAEGGESLASGIKVTAVVMQFLADHTQLLARVLPLLVAGLAAYRIAQLGANVAAAAGPVIRLLEIRAMKAHTAAIRENTAAQITGTTTKEVSTAATEANTVAQSKGVIAIARSVVVLAAQKVAQIASTAATWLATAATTALGVAIKFALGPVGLIIAAIGLLTAAVIYAYKHNETFRKIVDAVWKAIKEAIKKTVDWFKDTAWPIIKRAIDFMIGYYKFLWSVIKTVWNGIVAVIKFTVDKIVALFNVVKTFITVTIPNAFRTGVQAIGKFWAGLQELARRPIVFVVGIVNKLIGGYNKIASVFHAPTAPQIPGFAKGGQIPGTPSTVDNLMAEGPRGQALKVASGEYIVNARSTARNLPLLNAINNKGFADGGFVGGVVKFLTNPVGYIKGLAGNVGDVVGRFGNSGLAQTLVGMGKTLLDSIIRKAKTLAGGGGGKGQIFGPWPSSPSAQRGDSGVWRRVVALIQSTGPISGSFGNAYRPGDPLWHGSGRAVDWMGYEQDALASFLAAKHPLELIHRTHRRDYAYTRGRDKGSFHNALMEAHRNHVHVAFAKGGRVPTFDEGGTLRPGYNTVYNGLGRNEPLVPARGGDVHIHFHNSIIASKKHAEDLVVAGYESARAHRRLP